MLVPELHAPGRVIGRYVLYSEIAAGGMATVHLGRLIGAGGFSRTVAIKRLHPQFAKDPEFASMFLDEARLAGRVRHPNVASVLDVVALEGELFLVMDFVLGESLARLLRNAATVDSLVPLPVASGIMAGALRGLHAAHEATSESGEPLCLVHRDVSPHNVLVGVDGVARVVDFGVAKAANRAQTTRDGQLKGKVSYMAPEQVRRNTVDRRTDVYAAAVVLWETLVARRLFYAEDAGAILTQILTDDVDPPSRHRPEVPADLDRVVLRGLSRDPMDRFPTARDMAVALEMAVPPATSTQIGYWVEGMAQDAVERRARSLADVESRPADADSADSSIGITPAASRPASVHSESDATVVEGSMRRSMSSLPDLSTSAPRRPTTAIALGLFVAAAGVAVGLWLGRGHESAPAQVVPPEPSLAPPPPTAVSTESAPAPTPSASVAPTRPARSSPAVAKPVRRTETTPAGPAPGVDFDNLTRK